MSQTERVQVLRSGKIRKGKQFIAYWCHKALRTRYNHALEYAIHLANKHTLPLVVFTTIDNTIPHSPRHLLFEMQTQYELSESLAKRDIICKHLLCFPPAGAAYFAQEAASLIVDAIYLNEDREYYQALLQWTHCPVIQIESNVVVPVTHTSEHRISHTYEFRKKIKSRLEHFLVPIHALSVENPSSRYFHKLFTLPASFSHIHSTIHSTKTYRIEDIDVRMYTNISSLQKVFILDNTTPIASMMGGEANAQIKYQYFLNTHFQQYAVQKNNPSSDVQSGMSAYLRYGAISPIDMMIQAQQYADSHENKYEDKAVMQASLEIFHEELIVQRELSYNFVWYEPNYDNYKNIPSWAHSSLESHSTDHRPVVYTDEQIVHADTDDEYWNAAHHQLLKTGRIHGYMRMYWGKKILEWVASPSHAYTLTLALNNRYALDGHCPNSYAGVSWCYGTHDRPAKEAPIFGTVRHIGANDLRSEYDMKPYLTKWLPH